MGCATCSCNVYPRYNSVNPVHKDLMVIGESPTVIEVRNDRCMTGSGAKVLKETMQKVGLPLLKRMYILPQQSSVLYLKRKDRNFLQTHQCVAEKFC